VFRRRQRRRTVEGRKVCEVIEIVRDESELKRDLARREQHAVHQRESDQECRALLNRLEEGREADGFISELERIEPPKSELDDGLSELAIAVRDYLEQHPQRTAETPSWIASTLWAYQLVDGKPSQEDVAAALGELAAAEDRQDAA
jgi:hypothetical protein